VLLQGLWLTGIGLALGLAFALGLTRVFVRLWYGIEPTIPSPWFPSSCCWEQCL
jgi:hypothetical protein